MANSFWKIFTVSAVLLTLTLWHQGLLDLSTGLNVDEPSIQRMFKEWMIQHSVKYSTHQEQLYRYKVFLHNYKFILSHNQRYSQGLQTFTLSLNKFADLLNFEYQMIYTQNEIFTKTIKNNFGANTASCTGKFYNETIPQSIDWTAKGKVSSVRTQSTCVAGWAISAIGAIQSAESLKSGKSLVTLSVQQIISCSSAYGGNKGCNGGNVNASFWYSIDNKINTQAQYPYKGQTSTCQRKTNFSDIKLSSCIQVPPNNKTAILIAVTKTPVAVSVDASSVQFQFYNSGVFTGKCGVVPNHSMLMVGFGSYSNINHYKCRNSYGPQWGMDGYMLIKREQLDGPGQCGILMNSYVPVI